MNRSQPPNPNPPTRQQLKTQSLVHKPVFEQKLKSQKLPEQVWSGLTTTHRRAVFQTIVTICQTLVNSQRSIVEPKEGKDESSF